jgi:glycerophosphoryl diester phosphodiesterase
MATSASRVQGSTAPLRWADVARQACIVAHRGAGGLWPENSLLAFNRALAAGYRVFEIDVQGTRDHDLVVIHDSTVDRTSDGTGNVRELSTAQLGHLKLRGTHGEPIPLLNIVLALLRRHGAACILEVKFRTDAPEHDALCRRMVDAIAHADMLEATTISAFAWPSLVTLKRLAPGLNLTAVASARGLKDRGGLSATIAAAAELGVGDLALEWTAVEAGTAAAVHAHGLSLGVWTPNERGDIARMISSDVDWIITDRPDLAPVASRS